MTYLEQEAKFLSWYKKIPQEIKKSVLISFLIINFAFLFHSINFMFGDHDWLFVRGATEWKEGTFEGRPFHFVLQSILFNGQILPLLNNVFSFFALSLSGIILAKYWKIPVSTINYTLFSVFIAVLPYTLVWLYYAKDALINLSLPLIAISALYISDIATKKKNMYLHIIAQILLLFSFASYMAIVNYIGICFIGSIILSYVFDDNDILSIVKQKIYSVLDIIIALIGFIIILKIFPPTSSYNTSLISLDYVMPKLRETIIAMFNQFIVPLPFMELKYKLLLLMISLIGFANLFKSRLNKAPCVIILVLLALFVSKFSFFISEQRGQVLTRMEDFAFVPRLDFYSLPYLYALFISPILFLPKSKIKKICISLLIISVFLSLVRVMYAQRVWKLGFDAEMKAHERIVSRLESMPNFDINKKYRILQIGTLSLRKNYYPKEKGEKVSLDLLETSFTPQYMSQIVYNFYYPKDIFYASSSIKDLSLQGINFIKHRAKPWPSQDSIYIDGDIIIIVLDDSIYKYR